MLWKPALADMGGLDTARSAAILLICTQSIGASLQINVQRSRSTFTPHLARLYYKPQAFRHRPLLACIDTATLAFTRLSPQSVG
jgi:hypothetical protein